LPNRSTAVAHQFEDVEQQRESAALGMWVFLSTEIMFFGGMFLAYAVYRNSYPTAFAEASSHLDVFLGTMNTAILLCSSLTMALAVQAGSEGRSKRIALFLAITALLATTFISIKFLEYYHKYEEHLIPGKSFVLPGAESRHQQLFFSFYFVMTGMHALHMVIGIGLMFITGVRALRGRFSAEYFSPVEMLGLYWHFVDIVWVFLFPLLYLIDRSHG
jgi:cytochrome c oxidase subunit 3